MLPRRYTAFYIPTSMNNPPLEYHPWPPFIPDGARILIMGTFPPGEHRWSMDFYYPNRTNDFWRIMGLIFLGSPSALLEDSGKEYDLKKIKNLMTEKRIALNDTGHAVRRLKGNASDKFLEIVQPVDLRALLSRMPCCRNVATTGEKAAQVIAGLTETDIPRMGECAVSQDGLHIWRMPSTSRAYPLKLEKKAEYYHHMFLKAGIL